jgi:RNA polymerase sigma-70 factor (ECF subfamily)
MNHEETMQRDEAFARWYKEHHPRIRRLCARILRDEAMAEDMAQEALLRAWTRRAEMREADLGAWLSVVARNLCLSAMRRDKHLVSIDPLPEWADDSADPAIAAERVETRANIRHAMSRLGDRGRRVVYLRDVAEVEYEEIGEEFGLTPEGVRSIAFRARRVMREHLAAVGEGFSGFLVGVRVRIRSLRMRANDVWQGLEAGAAPAIQSGLNAVLAIGIALSSGGAVATMNASSAQTLAAIRVSSDAQKISSQPASVNAPVVQGGRTSSIRHRIGDPDLTDNELSPPTWDPKRHRGGIEERLLGEDGYVTYRGGYGSGIDPVWAAHDHAFAVACAAEPQVCAFLSGSTQD